MRLLRTRAWHPVHLRRRLPRNQRLAHVLLVHVRDACSPGMDHEERVLNLSDIRQEVLGDTDDFVFVDRDVDVPVWEHERLASPQPGKVNLSGIKSPAPLLDPSSADITSAYSVEQGFREMEVAELQTALSDGALKLVLDVRRAEDYASGHIAGSVNIPLEGVSAAVRAGQLEPYCEAPIAVIGSGKAGCGMRSSQAVVRLSKVFRFKDVRNVKGGIVAWQDFGLPLHGST